MNPTAANTIPRIGAGLALDPSPWDWILWGDRATTGRRLGRIDTTATLESKAASGQATHKNPTTEHTTTNIGAGFGLDPILWEWILCGGGGGAYQADDFIPNYYCIHSTVWLA